MMPLAIIARAIRLQRAHARAEATIEQLLAEREGLRAVNFVLAQERITELECARDEARRKLAERTAALERSEAAYVELRGHHVRLRTELIAHIDRRRLAELDIEEGDE